MRHLDTKGGAVGATQSVHVRNVNALTLERVISLLRVVKIARLVRCLFQSCGFEEALERCKHSDLEGRVEALVAEQLAHLLLHQRDDESLLRVLDPDRFVVHMDAAAPPLTPVQVLRVLHAADVDRRHAPDQKLPDSVLLLLVLLRAHCVELFVLLAAAEDIQLVPQVPVAFLDRCRREEEHACSSRPVPRKEPPIGTATGTSKRQRQHPVSGSHGVAESALQVVRLVHDDEIKAWQSAADCSRYVVLKRLLVPQVEDLVTQPRQSVTQAVSQPCGGGGIHCVASHQGQAEAAQA